MVVVLLVLCLKGCLDNWQLLVQNLFVKTPLVGGIIVNLYYHWAGDISERHWRGWCLVQTSISSAPTSL